MSSEQKKRIKPSVAEEAFKAVQYGLTDRLRPLLDAYPQLPEARDAIGNTLWLAAAACGNAEAFRELAPLSDKKAKNKEGANALLLSFMGRDDEIVEQAIEWVSPEETDSDGMNALMIAASHGAERWIARLIPFCDPSQTSRSLGQDALMIAASHHNADATIEALLAACDPARLDNDGFGALALAIASPTDTKARLVWAAMSDAARAAQATAAFVVGGSLREGYGIAHDELMDEMSEFVERSVALAYFERLDVGPKKMPKFSAREEAAQIGRAIEQISVREDAEERRPANRL